MAAITEDRSAGFALPDTLESMSALFDEAERRGWTDGLPIIPPTPAAVAAMLATVEEEPEEVIGKIPPTLADATVEKIAVCAVMAGCRAEYFPLVLAAVRATLEPQFELYGINSTTHPSAPMLIVNGPARHALDVNCSYGVMGPGWRANATVGRALSLVMINVGQRVPGASCRTTHGSPGRYTFCIGEFEEASPWNSYAAEHGFDDTRSHVTAIAAGGTTNVHDMTSRTSEGILTTIASSMTAIGSINMFPFWGLGPMLLVLCPEHAIKMAADGYEKEDVKQFLFEATKKIPIDVWPAEFHDAMRESGKVVNECTPLAARAEQFEIVVAGGRGGYHDVFVPTFGDSYPVTKPVLPEPPSRDE
jgi:hypothetical protein